MVGFRRQGLLLRQWREARGLTQSEAAAALGVPEPTLCKWESGRNGLSFDRVDALDALYGADGALTDMAKALGTAAGLPARREWTRYPPSDRDVSWAWVRPSAGAERVDGALLWGDIAFDLAETCTDDGLILHLPASSPTLFVSMRLTQPGWVDFGRARIPAEVGFTVVDAATSSCLTRVQPPRPHPDIPPPIVVDQPYPKAVIPRLTGADYLKLRQALCFSRKSAAERATALLDDMPVNEDMVRRLEEGADPPDERRLRSRLDVVYTAGGYSCNEHVSPRTLQSPFKVVIPPYWLGPVWFTFTASPGQTANVRLRRAEIVRNFVVTSGAAVAWGNWTRDRTPFEVTVPRGWWFETGMGARPGAPNVR